MPFVYSRLLFYMLIIQTHSENYKIDKLYFATTFLSPSEHSQKIFDN